MVRLPRRRRHPAGDVGYLADAATPRPPSTSPARWRSRCWSRAPPASARPSWPRPSPARPAPTWCGCSATRVSTRRGRSTSGTTRSSCCASRPRRARTRRGSETHDDIFTDEFLLTRPLLTAIRRDEPTVLLIDEVDKTDVEVEGLLLEVLSDFQVTIPELGTVTAVAPPVRGADLQRQPRAVRGAEASLPLPVPRLPRRRARARDRLQPGAGPRRADRHPARGDRRPGCASSSSRRRPRSRSPSTGPAPWSPWRSATSTPRPIDDTLGVVLKHASDQARAVRELRLRR